MTARRASRWTIVTLLGVLPAAIGIAGAAPAQAVTPVQHVAYLSTDGVSVADADGSSSHVVVSTTQNDLRSISLTPDGSEVAVSVTTGVEVAPADGSSAARFVATCSCGDVRWSSNSQLLVEGAGQDVVLAPATITTPVAISATATGLSALSGTPAAVGALSPDLRLAAVVDARRGLLSVRELAGSRRSYTVAVPTLSDPRADLLASAFWSPDGATILVASLAGDGDSQNQQFSLVDAATGTVLRTLNGLCGGDRIGEPTWAPDGQSFAAACISRDVSVTIRRYTLGGVSTLFTPATTAFPADTELALGGGAAPALGGPAVGVAAAAMRSGAAQITITAALPAADSGGAEITGPAGEKYGRLLGGRLVLGGLVPTHTYTLTVTPVSWDGSTGPASLVTVQTDTRLGTSTTVSAPGTALTGTRVSAVVRVTRSDTGHGVASRAVILRGKLVGGRVVIVGTGRTDAHGYLRIRYVQGDDIRLTATSLGDSKAGGSTSLSTTVAALIRLHAALGKRVALHRVTTFSFAPARGATGVDVLDATGRKQLAECFGSSCNLSVGKTFVLVPTGPYLDFDGAYLPAGPGVKVAVAK